MLIDKRKEEYRKRSQETKECLTNKHDLLVYINDTELGQAFAASDNFKFKKRHTLLFADYNVKDSLYGRTAIFESDAKMTDYLIKKGLDVNIVDTNGQNPLFDAISVEKCKILVKHGVNIQQVDAKGETALFHCRDLNKLNYLISLGLDVNHVNKNGETPLFANCNDTAKTDALLNAGANLNWTNNRGETVLRGASIALCKKLIAQGADLSYIPATLGETLKMFQHYPEKGEFLFEEKVKQEKNNLENILEKENKFKLSTPVRV